MATFKQILFLIVSVNLLIDAKPLPLDTFITGLAQSLKPEDLCELTNNIQNLMNETKNEEDRKSTLETLTVLKQKMATFEDFQCQVPVIVTLITTTTPEAITEEMDELSTNFPSSLDKSEQDLSESMCDDCEMDYDEEDKAREDFAQVLDEVEESGLSLKTITLIVIVSVCGLAVMVLSVFFCVKIFCTYEARASGAPMKTAKNNVKPSYRLAPQY